MDGELLVYENVTIYVYEIYANPSEKIFVTEKTDVYYIDETWSMDLFDLKECALKKINVIDII